MTAAGTGFSTPPDSTGAIGPNHYVEMVNSSVAVYDRNLTLLASTTLQSFINQAPGVFLCDPQVQWDESAQRWLFSFPYCNTASTVQRLFVGWSMGTSPLPLSSAGWCQFAINNDPYVMDYAKLGHNSNYLIVGGNLYNESTPTPNPPFAGAGILWVQKPANGVTTCVVPPPPGRSTFPLKNGDGVTYTFTPVPVNTDSNASDGYIVSAYDPAGNAGPPGPKSKVAVWHLDSAGVLRADNDVAVNTYDMPQLAPQLGSTFVLDTLDGRLTQAVGDPVTGFYTQHTVAGPSGRSEVHWYQFTVSGPSVVVAQQGSISSPTDWIFNAAISPRWDAQGAAIIYNRSSPSIYPVIAARIRYQATGPGIWAAGELVIASSTAPDTDRSCNSPPGSPCRWGDYAAATPDPVQKNLVWGTSEFNTASGTNPAWSDQIFAIAPTPEAPVNVVATGLRSTATVSWTPGAADPALPPVNYTVTAYVGSVAMGTMATAGSVTTLTFTGLTSGAMYTFTVIANTAPGPSLESARSNPVAIGALQSSPVPVPPRQPVAQSSPAPPPSGR
jgi:hypothetical protein